MKKTIVFDFDGVIHQKYNGYKDGSIYGTINYELLNYIKELLKDYYIVISSNRPAKQIVDYMNNNTDLDFEIFNKDDKNLYWEKNNIIGVTNQKAIGILYIDDRGFRYDKNRNAKYNIENIKAVLENKNINNKFENLQQRVDKAIEKLYCWGEAINPDFQKEMLSILKEEEK